MMGTLWEQDGVLIEDGGSLVECDDCPCDEEGFVCGPCDQVGAPAYLHIEFDVTFEGFANNFACNDCPDLDGTYRVGMPGAALNACTWTYDGTTTSCDDPADIGRVTLSIFESAGPTPPAGEIWMFVGAGFNAFGTWSKKISDGPGPINCATLTELVFDVDDRDTENACDVDGVTITVNAVVT